VSPDFDELIDDSVSPSERDELRAAHELLLSASAPPALGERRRRAPRIPSLIPRSRAIGALGFATAAAALIGLALGHALWHGSGFQTAAARPMHGVGPVAAARALIRVGKEDASGDRPLLISVDGLPALPPDHWYELYLTRKGKPAVLCGLFQTSPSGTATVRMNAPADPAEYDGWIVTALGPGQSNRVLLTTA